MTKKELQHLKVQEEDCDVRHQKKGFKEETVNCVECYWEVKWAKITLRFSRMEIMGAPDKTHLNPV